MTRDRQTTALEESPLRLLAGAIPVEDPAHVEARRSALTSAIADEITREAERAIFRSRRRRWLVGAGAAALVAVATLAFLGIRGALDVEDRAARGANGTVADVALVVRAAGASHTLARPGEPLAKGASLNPGAVLVTEASTDLSLELAGRTTLDVGAETHLELTRLAATEQAFVLRRGALRVDVPHPAGLGVRRVEVLTPEARVRVKGTRFGVEVRSSGTPLVEYTRVWVERGSVEVTAGGRSLLLNPGESWRSDATPPLTPEAPRSDAPPALEDAPPDNAPSAASSSRAPRTSTSVGTKRTGAGAELDDASTLAAQNRLFEEALAAERAGRLDVAEAKLLELLARYPTSPLRAAARTELGRLHADE